MAEDVIRYVCSCSVYAMSKTPCYLPAGKLVPRPVPQRPWSHIGVDFVTDLPNSEGHMYVRACGSGPFLQGLPIDSPERPTHSTRDGRESLPPCVPELRYARKHSVRHSVHVYGKPSFSSLGWQSACLPDTIPRLTARLSVRSKSLDVTFRSCCSNNQHSRSRFLPGPSMPKTPSDNPPPGLHPFNTYSVTLPMDGRALGGSSCGLLVPRGYGIQCTSISSGQCGGINSSQTSAVRTPFIPERGDQV